MITRSRAPPPPAAIRTILSLDAPSFSGLAVVAVVVVAVGATVVVGLAVGVADVVVGVSVVVGLDVGVADTVVVVGADVVAVGVAVVAVGATVTVPSPVTVALTLDAKGENVPKPAVPSV